MNGTPFNMHSAPDKRGRVTVCAVVSGTEMKFGVAKCSNKDSFQKTKGRLIATGRANKAPNNVVTIPSSVKASGHYGKFFLEHAKVLAEKTLDSETLPKPVETGRSLFARVVSSLFG